MRAPLHRRTEKIGACLADPFANGEGRIELIRSPSPKGRRRRVYRPWRNLTQHRAQCQSKNGSGAAPTNLSVQWWLLLVRRASAYKRLGWPTVLGSRVACSLILADLWLRGNRRARGAGADCVAQRAASNFRL